MKASDIVALPLQLGSAVRHRRVFHPLGVLAAGRIERTAPPGEGLPVESSDIVARVSKAAVFVAQWGGDDRSRGAGSAPLRIPGPTK